MQRLLLFPSSPFLNFVLLVALKQTITVGAALVELEYYSVSLVIIQHTTYTAISSNKISEDQLEDHHENKDTGQIGKTWGKKLQNLCQFAYNSLNTETEGKARFQVISY